MNDPMMGTLKMTEKVQHWYIQILMLLCVCPLLVHEEEATTSIFMPRMNTNTSSLSPSPTSLPPGSIVVSSCTCLYIMMSLMNITILNSSYTNTSTSLLELSYSHNDTCECGGVETYNQTYFDSDDNPQFWIYFQFNKLSNSGDWNLSQLKHRNISQPNSLFTYDSCGSTITASVGQGYQCSSVVCHGNENIGSVSIESQVTMHNVTFQAFKGSEQLKESYVVCGQVTHHSQTVYIVVGLVVGGTVVFAVIVILASFAYKRWRYGPYNLLD